MMGEKAETCSSAEYYEQVCESESIINKKLYIYPSTKSSLTLYLHVFEINIQHACCNKVHKQAGHFELFKDTWKLEHCTKQTEFSCLQLGPTFRIRHHTYFRANIRTRNLLNTRDE
jgi:hypothetical protein